MSPPDPLTDLELTPAQRLSLLAEILARGLARWRARPGLAAAEPPDLAPEILSESRPGGLEVPAKVRLTVHTGLRGPDSQLRSD
jgi:hypothetical protein